MKQLLFYCTSIILLFGSFSTSAQDTTNLLSLVDDIKQEKEYVKYAFKSPRVINGQSMEFLAPGTMDFRILHRFGLISEGYDNFFGLDQASMRMSFDFGLKRNLMTGIGRSTYKKELDAFVKYAPLMQSTGEKAFPFTLALVAGITMNTSKWADPSINNYFTSRLGFFYQAIIGRKFSNELSLQLTPTLVHTNLVALHTQPNDVFSLGFGGRYKLSNRLALTWDYFHLFNGIEEGVNTHPLAIGLDIETGGHVFQLHFSNSSGMNERAFINETINKWSKAEIRFGFNLSRVFQIAKRSSPVE